MTNPNIEKKIEPYRDVFRIAAIAQDDPGFIFPCIVKMSNPGATLPQGIHADSVIGELRTCRVTYDQLHQMADSPDVLSFSFR